MAQRYRHLELPAPAAANYRTTQSARGTAQMPPADPREHASRLHAQLDNAWTQSLADQAAVHVTDRKGVYIEFAGTALQLKSLESFRGPRKLLISPRAISLAIVLPWNPEKQLKHLAAENIEELLISSEVTNSKKVENSATLRFVTDDDIIEFGKGHNISTLEWIRGCAASVLSAKGVL
jgi:hypothetical protein